MKNITNVVDMAGPNDMCNVVLICRPDMAWMDLMPKDQPTGSGNLRQSTQVASLTNTDHLLLSQPRHDE